MGYLRDELDRLSRERARPGRPPEPIAPREALGWLAAAGSLIRHLKTVDPDRLLAEIWRLEREADEVGVEQVERLAAHEGGMPNLIEKLIAEMGGREGGSDGGALDIRPPGRGGDRR